MNLIKTLDDIISEKKLTKNEALRIIYLYVCNYFTFDPRWFYTSIWGDKDLLNEIKEKKVDLENVTDNKVICHSVAKSVFKPLVQDLTGFKCTVKESYDHSNVLVETFDGTRKLDPVFGDFSRVKIGLQTEDYEGISRSELEKIDKSLGYNFKRENKLIDAYEKLEPLDNILKFQKMLKNEKLSSYSDVRYLFSSLIRTDYFLYETYVSRNYEFIHLIKILHHELYYMIKNEKGYFELTEINKDTYNSFENNDLYRSKVRK